MNWLYGTTQSEEKPESPAGVTSSQRTQQSAMLATFSINRGRLELQSYQCSVPNKMVGTSVTASSNGFAIRSDDDDDNVEHSGKTKIVYLPRTNLYRIMNQVVERCRRNAEIDTTTDCLLLVGWHGAPRMFVCDFRRMRNFRSGISSEVNRPLK